MPVALEPAAALTRPSMLQLAVVFLSLRFHKLQPLYIHGRIKALQRNFRAFLLCHCDVEDPVAPLADVTKLAIDSHCTLLVAFSPLECARYLEVLKAYEKKPADAIKARVETDYVGRCALEAVHTCWPSLSVLPSRLPGRTCGLSLNACVH